MTIQLDGTGRQLDDWLVKQTKGAPAAQESSDGPVFVDESGRRSRRFRRLGMVVGVACAVYAVVILVTLLSGNSNAPWIPVPGQQDDQPAGKVDTSPMPTESVSSTGTGNAAPGVIGATPSDGTTPSPGVSPRPDVSASASNPGVSPAPEPSTSASTKPNPSSSTTKDPVIGPSEPVTNSPDPSPSVSAPSPDPSASATTDGSGVVADSPVEPVPVEQIPTEPEPSTTSSSYPENIV
ncbi:hypothetical protein ACFWFF_08540 [Streptomyces sp. NPDC060223]|uniref:hypothetical protein n=1 Tax=unclassified Streptomyces TaxID=2593676 RepID=UPI00362C5B57